MIITGMNISMIRGDSETIIVSCKNKDGSIRSFIPGDTVYLTVKSSIAIEKKALQKVITEFQNGKAIIKINSEDTKRLDFREYVYDIQLNESNGSVTTIIPPSTFEIRGEVTYE